MKIKDARTIIACKRVVTVPDGVSESTAAAVKSTLTGGTEVTPDLIDAMVILMNREVRELEERNNSLGPRIPVQQNVSWYSARAIPQFLSQPNTAHGYGRWMIPCAAPSLFTSNLNFVVQPPLLTNNFVDGISKERPPAVRVSREEQRQANSHGDAAADETVCRPILPSPKSLETSEVCRAIASSPHSLCDELEKASFERGPECDNLALVYRKIHHWLGKKASEQNHAGIYSGAYAEVTEGSMIAIQEMLQKHDVLQEGDTVVDLGSGTGCFLFDLCQRFKCRGIGCEHQPVRQLAAAVYTHRLIQDCEGSFPHLLNPNVYLSFDCIQSLEHLPSYIKLGYQFDQEFPPTLMNHIFDLYYRFGPSYLLSCSSRDKGTWIENGYEVIDQVRVRKAKASTNAANTFYLYKRKAILRDDDARLVASSPLLRREKDIFSRAEEYFSLPIAKKMAMYQSIREEMESFCRRGLEKRKHKKRRHPFVCGTAVPVTNKSTNVLALLMARTDPGVNNEDSTPQLVRDTTRCEETERRFAVTVFTADIRECLRERFSKNHHTICDVNKVVPFPDETFSEIYVDWYWYKNSYLRQRLRPSFYNRQLIELGRRLEMGGSIYLPLSPSSFVRTLNALEDFHSNLELELLSEADMSTASLFQATVAVQHRITSKMPFQHRDLGLTDHTLRQECMIEGVPEETFLKVWRKGRAKCSGIPIFIRLFAVEQPCPSYKRRRI